MPKSKRPEFLKQDPSKVQRNPVLEVLHILIPLLFILIGGQIAAQYWAHAVHFQVQYTDLPWYITKHKIFGLEKGYPLFNFFNIFLTILANPFDKTVETYVLNFLIPFFIASIFAVASFLIIGILIRRNSKNRHVYDTGRWANEKDLKKFGLSLEHGVVLGQQVSADITFTINPQTAGLSLVCHKIAPLVCHAGGTNTLLIAPTRAGKGIGPINSTLVNYPGSMIVFDPKGELYKLTGGFRAKFSRVLKFSPISDATVAFNPLEEVELTKQAFADIGLILANVFEPPKGGSDGTNEFFDNQAQTLLTAVIFHVLSSGKYPKEQQNMSGVLSVLSIAAGQKEDPETGEEVGLGDLLLKEIIDSPHFDKDGNESESINEIVRDAANQILSQHEKVRSDVFSTVFAKMQLFRDPYIKGCTSHSDFKIQDFYDSPEPISLYLTVPFSHIDRVAPVFKLMVNFLLRKFSAGEMLPKGIKGMPDRTLKNRLLFLLDEFRVLGAMPFLSTTMGILSGYGITFFIVVQMLSQIYDLYGQHQAFLDNCETVAVMAPGNIDDATKFSQMLGKESVVNGSQSVSGSKFALDLSNINQSYQDIQRDLLSPSEVMHMGKEYILIFKQGMPGYLAKKVVSYMDPRFKDKIFYQKDKLDKDGNKIINPETGEPEGEIVSGFMAPYTKEEIESIVKKLPSQKKSKGQKSVWEKIADAAKSYKGPAENSEVLKGQAALDAFEAAKRDAEQQNSSSVSEAEEKPFSLEEYLENYDPESEVWDEPTKKTEVRDDPPPHVKQIAVDDFK